MDDKNEVVMMETSDKISLPPQIDAVLEKR